MSLPSKDDLTALIEYDPDTGKLFWKERPRDLFKSDQSWRAWNTRYAYQPCFDTERPDGYLCGDLFGKSYLAHRVIWVLLTGEYPEQIDHIDGDRSHNKLKNLRAVSGAENQRNMKRSNRNSTGVTGITQLRGGSFQVTIGKRYVGLFPTIEEATAARKAAEQVHGFHENHGRIQ